MSSLVHHHKHKTPLMAFSPSSLFPPNNLSLSSHCSSLSSFPFLILQSRKKHSFTFTTLKLKISSSSSQIIEIGNEDPHKLSKKKKKQKPRPSFYQQVQEKWSLKIASQRPNFPWQHQQRQQQQQEEEEEEKEEVKVEVEVKDQQPSSSSNGENPASYLFGKSLISPPWVHRKKPHFSSEFNFEENSSFDEESNEMTDKDVVFKVKQRIEEGFSESEDVLRKPHFSSNIEFDEDSFKDGEGVSELVESEDKQEVEGLSESGLGEEVVNLLGSSRVEEARSIEIPWDRRSVEGDKLRKSNTEVAEKMIPEAELRRLRNVSLRMKERIKVRAGGITQALVDTIHQKWESDEVVKLRFEGPLACNMKRAHETLESRAGGLVIWRSGSLLVLYRGMTYKLPCVKSYTKLSEANKNVASSIKDSITVVGDVRGNVNDSARANESPLIKSAKFSTGQSEELMNTNDLNNLLDELGPRFIDWSGREPKPVDADLLPCVVPGYSPPFRLLLHGIRPTLGNKALTTYRRLARVMPPQFALGRSRDLQGLAMAIVKLWEKNAIAKIAIKRGIQNTNNERMAEELKNLTGGTLLSRNVDYIVFHRGNDFLSPSVKETLLERKKLAELQHDEEEKARNRASALFVSNIKASNGPTVAGTLAETIAAKSRWGAQPSSKDLEKMKTDFALAKRASLVRYLEKKLVLAQDKVNRAESALGRVQESLKPAELPSDLETISDEERFLFRKIGLSMKPFLLVGRSGVFDGTVENMHLHWKHRELVKIIVRGKNFPQVKHIAISLEAESGGLLVSMDKTTKGYVIIMYRGKNYQRPCTIRPKNLLTKRQALARSVELQRREGLTHHISDLREQIELIKYERDQMVAVKKSVDEEAE